MAYNRGPYNRSPYNRSATQSILVEIECNSGVSVDVDAIVEDKPKINVEASTDIAPSTVHMLPNALDAHGAVDITLGAVYKVVAQCDVNAAADMVALPTHRKDIGLLVDAAADILADSYAGQTQRLDINTVLPPGGIIVMNSCRKRIWADGVDIFELHEGEFIKLTPKSEKIVVHSDTGGIFEVKVIWTPRWK